MKEQHEKQKPRVENIKYSILTQIWLMMYEAIQAFRWHSPKYPKSSFAKLSTNHGLSEFFESLETRLSCCEVVLIALPSESINKISYASKAVAQMPHEGFVFLQCISTTNISPASSGFPCSLVTDSWSATKVS